MKSITAKELRAMVFQKARENQDKLSPHRSELTISKTAISGHVKVGTVDQLGKLGIQHLHITFIDCTFDKSVKFSGDYEGFTLHLGFRRCTIRTLLQVCSSKSHVHLSNVKAEAIYLEDLKFLEISDTTIGSLGIRRFDGNLKPVFHLHDGNKIKSLEFINIKENEDFQVYTCHESMARVIRLFFPTKVIEKIYSSAGNYLGQ